MVRKKAEEIVEKLIGSIEFNRGTVYQIERKDSDNFRYYLAIKETGEIIIDDLTAQKKNILVEKLRKLKITIETPYDSHIEYANIWQKENKANFRLVIDPEVKEAIFRQAKEKGYKSATEYIVTLVQADGQKEE